LVAPLLAGEVYVLGPGDVVSFSLYGEPDMSRDCSIRGDGSVFLPMLKDKIHAAGKTADELQEVIADSYRSGKLFKDPIVTVVIKEFRSSPVTLTGAVNRPATIQVQGRTSLLQAITMVGGLTPKAGNKIHINHAGTTDATGTAVPGSSETVVLRDLLDHPDDPKLNVMLRGGDIVTVQLTDYVYVGGAVMKPGMLAMNEVDTWTVLKALAASGNLTKIAKRDASVIIRKKPDGTTEQIPLHLAEILQRKSGDVTLYANDILLIPESMGMKALYAAAQTLNGASGGLVTGLVIH
jgi:polysaccharide export outer membrane protein